MATTSRLELPLLAAGQAQKEMVHNDALATLDLLVQPVVEAVAVDAPPAAPAAGRCWVVGPAPVGAWSGRAGAIAGWTGGGWRFVAAAAGMTAWSVADGTVARYGPGGWTIGQITGRRVAIDGIPVLGPRRAAIPDPASGTVTDAEARGAITAILAALRGHGLIAG